MVKYSMVKYADDFEIYAAEIEILSQKIRESMNELKNASDADLYNKIFGDDVLEYLEKSKGILLVYGKNIKDIDNTFNSMDFEIGNSFKL